MRKFLTCGRGHFDPALQQTYTPPVTAGGPLVYGGYATPATSGDALQVSVLGHAGSLRALDHIGSRPPAGAEGYTSRPLGWAPNIATAEREPDFWEPTPAHGLPGNVIRRTRLLLVIPSRGTFSDATADGTSPGVCAGRVAALWAGVLKPLGLTVCVSSRELARDRPLLAAVPIATVSAYVTPSSFGSDFQYRLTVTTPPADNLPTGCDVLVIELNDNRWTYGGTNDNSLSSIGYTRALFRTHGAFAGGVVYPFPNTIVGVPYDLLVFPADAAADLAVARRLAARCDRYGHHVYQMDRYAINGGTADLGAIDDAAVYASLYGGADFAVRRVVPGGDPDGLWLRIRQDVAAFFG